jgi:hypothetical protein
MEAPCRELLRRCRDRADIYHMAQWSNIRKHIYTNKKNQRRLKGQ